LRKIIISQQNQLNEHTISILSHDIKEPLLGVKLMLKKLNVNDPFLAQASLSLENQINSVNGILNNLLKMKKLSLTENTKVAKADVLNVVQLVVKDLHLATQTKNITIDNQLPENFTLPIAPEKLQIVIHNLLSNAVKYSYPDQTIKIYKEGNGFCIQDFGVGLTAEQSLKLMSEVKPSQQGTSLEKGNGMGLFLVGMILQGEKIKIMFDSPEIGGTIVKILS
jgi:signal transduction histidine kinase